MCPTLTRAFRKFTASFTDDLVVVSEMKPHFDGHPRSDERDPEAECSGRWLLIVLKAGAAAQDPLTVGLV